MRILNIRLLIGLFIIVLGALLFLNQLGYLEDVPHVGHLWPIIPVIIGINWLVSSFYIKNFFPWGKFVTSLILIIIGSLYLGHNLGYLDDVYIEQFWNFVFPILLILAGLSLLRGKIPGGSGKTAIMGSVDAGDAPWKLESGSYLAFMGGMDLDLTTAEIPEGETVLDLTAVMGGIDIIVPSHVSVSCEGTAVMGAISLLGNEDGGVMASHKTGNQVKQSHSLIRVQARSFMGGVEIKEKWKDEKK